jgi:hypothetical protein
VDVRSRLDENVSDNPLFSTSGSFKPILVQFMKLRIIAWLGYKRGKGDIEDIEKI